MTPKQQRFCDEYLKQKNPNGKQAAIKAGYSPKTAESMASQLLRNIKVRNYIDKARAKVAAKVEISAEWVLEKLREEAERFKQGTAGARVKSLELLGKHLSMFIDRLEVKDVTPTEVREEVVATRADPTDPAPS